MSVQATSTFTILPAIDLRGGQVVRLRQGDYGRERAYRDDPVAVALEFVDAGATWIHVVDLDGARAGERRQGSVVASIAAAVHGRRTGTRVEAAGGLRTAADIDAALGDGADRVVLGTSAIRNADLVASTIARHGAERVVVALDVRDGQAIGDGWVPGATSAPLGHAIRTLTEAGVATFAITAIARDGLLEGPDLDLLRLGVASTTGSVIASGGIRSTADLEATRALGCVGAIVGRAIYDGQLDLAEAIQAMRPARSA